VLRIELSGTGTPTSPTTFNVFFQGTIIGGTGRFAGAQGIIRPSPGTVDLVAGKVKARLEGTISRLNLPYTDD
jgi:hypothetical protein